RGDGSPHHDVVGAGRDGRRGRGGAHLIVLLAGGTRFLMGGPGSASPHTPFFAGCVTNRTASPETPLFAGRATDVSVVTARANTRCHYHEFLPELEPQRADLARRGHAAVEPRGFRQSSQTEYMALDRRDDTELGVEGVAIEARQHCHSEADGPGHRQVFG